jgi:hypothetical protein
MAEREVNRGGGDATVPNLDPTAIMAPKQQRCKLTSEDQLLRAFNSVSSLQPVELSVLQLLDLYSFDLNDLCHLLLSLNPSL